MTRYFISAWVWMAVFIAPAPAAEGPFWPQFHGPRRDNMSDDKGLLRQWPADGPKLLWKATGCGRGYASVSIAEGLLFTSGDIGSEQMVMAFDLEGNLRWKSANGLAWRGPQPGSRTTPTWHDGVVYHLNAHGILTAFEAKTGKRIWSVNVAQRFEARPGGWGYAKNVIVEKDMVLCTPGGTRGRVVALDRRTGETIWANTEIADRAAYGSPIVVSHGGKRLFINFMNATVVGVDAATGKLLWTHKHPSTCDQNVTRPLYHDGCVFVTSGHRGGGRWLRLDAAGGEARELWFDRDFDNCHGGVMLLDGHLYFSGCRLYNKGLICVDVSTGKRLYRAEEIGKVSITWAEGLLYCLGNDGEVLLVNPAPGGARIISRFALPRTDRENTLAHPVVCGRRLYLRHLDQLWAYDMAAQ